MAPENGQSDNLKNITTAQSRLEGLGADKEASKEIKAKISSQEYRKVYKTSLDEGKNSLASAISTFKTKEAGDYLKAGATKLDANMTSLANKGFELKQKTSTEELKPLDSLKDTLAAELDAEKKAITEFRSIEGLSTELDLLKKRSDSIDKTSGFANLTSNLNLKDQLLKTNSKTWDKLIDLKIKPDSVANALSEALYKKFSALDDALKSDAEHGAKFEVASLIAKQQAKEVGLLETQINTKPKPMLEADYQNFSTKLKEKALLAYSTYTNQEMAALSSGNSPFLDPLGKVFAPQYYEPLMLKLDNAVLGLEAKRPKKIKLEDDTELFNDTAVAQAKVEFRNEAKLISELEKQIDEAYKAKVEKPGTPNSPENAQVNDRAVFDKIAAQIKERNTAHAEIVKVHGLDKLAEWKTPPQKDLSIVVSAEYRNPNKNRLDALQTKQTARETIVENNELKEMLSALDKSWEAEVNGQTLIFDKAARTVKQTPNFDEQSQEFKDYLLAEKKLLGFVVDSQSKVNLKLSKKDLIDKVYLPRLEEYQKLSDTYLSQIGNNRTERNLKKASAAIAESTATYTVPGAERKFTRYVPSGEGPREKVEEYRKDPDRQESFKYKFSDYIEFINLNDPKFKEINEGKGWRFKPDKFGQLPEQMKILLAQQAANIINEDKNSGQKEVFKEKQNILSKKDLFDKAKIELGEKGDLYFGAVKAFGEGKYGVAYGKFRDYLESSKTFDKETKQQHQPYIEQANGQIEALRGCAPFYVALKLLKTNPSEGIKGISQFIVDMRAKPPEDQKKFAEQISAAVEIVREYNLAKYKSMEELRDDLLTLSVREFQEGAGSSRAPDKNTKGWRLAMAEKGLNGPEVKQMNEFFTSIKTKIDAGEPVDFDAAFKSFAAQQQAYLRYIDPKNKLHPDDYKKDKDGNYPPEYPNGHGQIDGPSNRLITLFEKINTDDTKKKEAGYVEVAKLFYGKETGMRYTQKYLDKAMASTYQEYLNSPDGIKLQADKKGEMTKNGDLAKAIGEGATEMYKQYVEEENKKDPKPNPALDAKKPFGPIFDSFKAQIFNSRYEAEVKRQARKALTDKIEASVTLRMDHINDPDPADIVAKRKGGVRAFMQNPELYQKFLDEEAKKPFRDKSAKEDFFRKQGVDPSEIRMLSQGGYLQTLPPPRPIALPMSPALALFNKSMPHNASEAQWYKPWSWSDYDEDNWEDFKVKSAEFALETLATLPIGMGAGAIGKLATRAALRFAMKGAGTVLTETALTAFEQGGIRALLAEQSLSAISKSRLILAWGGGLAAEGTSMFIMNSAWEGISTGHVSWAEGKDKGFWKFATHLVEAIGKASVFRAIGAGQGKILQSMGPEASGLKKVATVALGEAFSGVASTSMEAAILTAQGKGDQVTLEFWLKSIAQNSLMSLGTHIAHKATSAEHPVSAKEKAKYTKEEHKINTERLAELGIEKAANVADVRVTPKGEIIVNGITFDPKKFNFEIMPAPIREALVGKIVEAKLVAGKTRVKTAFEVAGVVDPADIVSVNNGKMVTKKGVEIPIVDTEHLPDQFKPRVEELRRAEAKSKLESLKALERVLKAKEEYTEKLKDDPTNENYQALVELFNKQLEAAAKERGVAVEKLPEHLAVEGRLYKALDSIYAGEKSLYHESKVIKKPVLDENGVQKMGPDNKPLFEDVNLFQNYETKTSAYSTELLKSLDYATLVKEGGFKLIKVGGDEIILYHAGPDGKVQKLFIDISNMGPTNDTALNINGTRVNLVDIYLTKIGEHMRSQAEKYQGKALDPVEFMKGFDTASHDLFSLDRGLNGEKIPQAEAEAKFNKLKKEWNLEGTYADYQKAVDSLRIMAEYRSDTRSLAASFKETKGTTFDQHITSQIEKIAGLPLPEIQKLIADHPEAFTAALEGRTPTSEKLIKRNEQGEIISGPPSVKELLDRVAKLKPGSKAEDLMPLYNMLARLDASKLSTPALKPLTENLQKTRVEMVGEPPHPRVEAPRIMDAKIVSIDLPPEITKALQNMDPVQAHAILTAARTLSEHALDALKYSKSPEFGKFNILDHVEVVAGKIVIKKDAKEFRDSYNENLTDKKVSNIAQIEKSIQAIKAHLEELRSQHEQGKMLLDEFKLNVRLAEAEIGRLEDRLSTDPDTGAFTQAYLDLKPNRIFSFDGGDVLPQDRLMHSVVTELGQFGELNTQYGITNADRILTAYYDVLKTAISKELPGDLAHFKIIRAGGGKFEIIFLDVRSIEALSKKGLTPESLIQKIAEGPGKKAIEAEMAKNPEAKAKAETGAAVRNSLFENIKGNKPLHPGEITITTQQPITAAEFTAAVAANPKASARELIGLVMRERSAAKAVEVNTSKIQKGDLDPALIVGVEGNKLKLKDGTIVPIEQGKLPLKYQAHLEQLSPGSSKAFETPVVKLTELPSPPLTRNEAPRPISEVPRPTEVMAVGDLHGNGEIFVSNLQSLKVVAPGADFHNPESMKWTGGDRKIVFHGDILGDRGTQSLEIMASIRKLQAEARAAGGDIILLAGNHEDWAISFITGKELPGGGMDAFNTSMAGKEQGKGLLEFIKKFSGDPRYEKATSLEEIAKIAGFKVDSVLGNKMVTDEKFPAYVKQLQQQILKNMRSNPEGRVILEQMASLRVGEYINDTLFFHTDPTQAMVDLIDKNGKTVGEGMDAINKKYQQGLRYLLLGEGTMPPDFQAISDAFTDTGNRSGEYNYKEKKSKVYNNTTGKYETEIISAEVKLDGLQAKGVNRIIHGHSDYNGKLIVKDGIEITSVDYSAGKKGTNMEGRSVAVISKDKGKLTTGTAVEALPAAPIPLAIPKPKKLSAAAKGDEVAAPEKPKPVEAKKPEYKFSEEDLKTPSTPEAQRDQLYADARRLIGGPVVENMIKANQEGIVRQMLQQKPEYLALREQRRELVRQAQFEIAAKEFSPEQKAALELFKDRPDVPDTIEKIKALPPEIIDVMLKAPLSKEYRESLLHKEYLQIPGTDQIVISSSQVLGKGGIGEVKMGIVIVKNAAGEYVAKQVAIKKPHPTSTGFAKDMASNAEVSSYANTDGLLKPLYAGTTKDGFGKEQPVVITEVVVAKPEYGKADLMAAMNKESNPAVIVDFFEQSLIGLDTIHSNGSIHLDFKPAQVMVGAMGEKSGAFLGDFSFIKAEDLPHLQITTRKVTINGQEKIVPVVIDTRTGKGIPTTPSYLVAFRDHLQKAIDYAKAHPGEKLPQHILELPDRGAFARMLQIYVAAKGSLAKTPGEKKLFQDTAALAKRLADPADSITLKEARESLAGISAEYREKGINRLYDTAATNTSKVAELIAQGKLSGDPTKIEGYTDSDGKIYLNTDYWNKLNESKTGPDRLLKEGYKFIENPNPADNKGPLLIVGPDPANPGQNKQFSFRDYAKQVEGRSGKAVLDSPVYQRFEVFKTHEVLHRTIEIFKDNKVLSDNLGPSTFSVELVKSVQELAKLLPADSPLRKQIESSTLTFKAAQEIICEILDHSKKHPEVSALAESSLVATMKKLFQQVGINDFSRSTVRSIDTRLLVQKPLEAFTRVEGSDAKSGYEQPPSPSAIGLKFGDKILNGPFKGKYVRSVDDVGFVMLSEFNPSDPANKNKPPKIEVATFQDMEGVKIEPTPFPEVPLVLAVGDRVNIASEDGKRVYRDGKIILKSDGKYYVEGVFPDRVTTWEKGPYSDLESVRKDYKRASEMDKVDPRFASSKFKYESRIDEKIPDGFADGGRGNSREIIVVDRKKDPYLKFLIEQRISTLRLMPPENRLVELTKLVFELTESGTLAKAMALEHDQKGKPVLLGEIIKQGAAVCRHRSLLFKILADELGFHTSVVRGTVESPNGSGAHAWNEVRLADGRVMVVDLTYVVGGILFRDAAKGHPSKYYDNNDKPLYGAPPMAAQSFDQTGAFPAVKPEKPKEVFAKAKEFDPHKIPEGTLLADGTYFRGVMPDGLTYLFTQSASASDTHLSNPISELPGKLKGTTYENPDRVTVEKLYQDFTTGTVKFNFNNPEHQETLRLKLKPEDFAVVKNNPDISPEVLSAVLRGGQEFFPGLRTYNGKFLGNGAYGMVSEIHYVEIGTGKLKTGVVKVPFNSPESRANFKFEADAAREILGIQQGANPNLSKHLIKPISVSDQAIIYEKASDAQGQTTNLEKTMATSSNREWLTQFAGGVDGLIFMLDHGMSHNDFKPANIVAGPEGGVLIDIGSKVSITDITSGKVQIKPFNGVSTPLAHYVSRDAYGVETHQWVAQDPKYNNAFLLNEVVARRAPIDIPDKFAVGKSLIEFMTTKGLNQIPPGANPFVDQMRNIANALVDAANHPYPFKGNNPAAGRDPYYIHLATVSQHLKYIATNI